MAFFGFSEQGRNACMCLKSQESSEFRVSYLYIGNEGCMVYITHNTHNEGKVEPTHSEHSEQHVFRGVSC